MGKNYDFDYVIIGSGLAGRTLARKLASENRKIAIVEASDFGGAEINTRDLPYKLNLDFAQNFHTLNHSPAVNQNSCHFNFPTLMSKNQEYIGDIRNQEIAEIQNLGIRIIDGYADFVDQHTISVNGKEHSSRFFIIATGSSLKATEITGLESVAYLSPDTVFNLKRLPKFVFVVGGGPSGVEIAEFFALLGIGVIIMERGNQLLPKEDAETSQVITDYFTNELGITVVTGSKVTAITEDHSSKIVVFTSGAGEKMVRVDSIVLATGSVPNLDLNLENAGVKYKTTGITVDKYFATSAKNIFAIGDCIGDEDSSSARVSLQASILANNFLHRQKLTPVYTGRVKKIGTHPEIAITGLNERDILSRDLKSRRAIVHFSEIPTLSAPEYKYGFVKLITDTSLHLIGATIVAPHADDIISELSLVIANHLTVESLVTTPHDVSAPAAAIALAAKKLLTK